MNPQTDEEIDDIAVPWWKHYGDSLGAVLCSLGLHIALLALLALIVVPLSHTDPTRYLTVRTTVVSNPRLETLDNLKITPAELNEGTVNDLPSVALATTTVSDQPNPMTIDTEQKELQWQIEAMEYLGQEHARGELSGRSEEARSLLVKAFGGTASSEKAVASGLLWLKNHQNKDGSWSFDHRRDACGSSCTQAGSLRNATVGATSMALLCFVGAGHTHETGKYQKVIQKGLVYLVKKFHEAETPGDMRQLTTGNSGMYTQGITTILFCEVYGLTRDRAIGKIAQKCVDFIVDAQHPQNGGWRYRPNQEDGDTSVVGWQVMALASAKMARLTVRGRTNQLAKRFLDSVQLENGAFYGYARPEKKASTTAIGLLCRMYYGWTPDDRPLEVGVNYLSALGPSRDNQYYNYYATQVMHHWGGPKWKKWNNVMREQLVSTQVTEGHAAGSWAPRDPHGKSGGRHYMTCLAIMTLEVYYRHLPIYQRQRYQSGV